MYVFINIYIYYRCIYKFICNGLVYIVGTFLIHCWYMFNTWSVHFGNIRGTFLLHC